MSGGYGGEAPPVAAGQIPATMRAVVWRGETDPMKMKVETLVTPKPLKGEVLIKVHACGVCHTDLHVIKGEVPFPKPGVLGHEVSGVVVALGQGVARPDLLGQKVISPFIMPCGGCYFCKRGEEDTCEPFFALNRGKGQIYDDVSTVPYKGSTRLKTPEGEEVAMYSMAGLAEYCVTPITACFPLPEKLGSTLFAESAILGCMFFTAYGVVHNAAKLQAGETVACIGCGGVGSAVIQIAKFVGASMIIAVDIGEEKLEAAKRNGATHTVDAREDVPAKIAELTGGRKVDVCFEAIGLKKTFENSVMSVRDGGRAVYVGIADVKTKAEIPITHVVRRRISLIGSYGARATKDVPALLELTEKGGVDILSPISRRFSLDNANEAYALLMEGKILGRAIVNVEAAMQPE
jgi:S-(hydroxymethyl)glutathione dehydrogenase/alcohol dehydrogenase